jgi:hypothetical protein
LAEGAPENQVVGDAKLEPEMPAPCAVIVV